MSPRSPSPAPARAGIAQLVRPVDPATLSAEEHLAYTHFLERRRDLVWIKAAINALLIGLFLCTVIPSAPGTILIVLIDGLLLLPYFFLARRWPVPASIVMLTLTAVAIAAAEAVSGYQTSTSGVFYAALIVASAVLLLHPRSIAITTVAITIVFASTYLLEMAQVIPIKMVILTPQEAWPLMALHILAFLGLGALASVLARLYRQMLQDRAAIAVENIQLSAEAQERLQTEVALFRIGQEVASHLRMSELVPAIYRHIAQVMDVASFLIAIKRPHGNDLQLLSPIDEGQVVPDRVVSSQGVLGWVVRNRRALRFGDMQREIAAHPDIQLQPIAGDTFIPGALLSVPLLVGDQVVGALSVQSPQPDVYDERDERLLTTMANHVAVAVQNARLYDEVQRKQAELQGLIAAVAQSLQGPVEALSGFGRLLKDSVASRLSPEQRDYMERLERNSRWIAQLTQDMLFLARLGQVQEEVEPVALSTLVHGVVANLELESQGIAVTIRPDMPTLYADPVLLWAYFRNVLHNSRRLLGEAAAPQIEVGCAPAPEGYLLYVQGNGATLPPEQLARAYELFFPIGGTEGAGIGLAIARRIAEQYGGRVWATAAAGQGTILNLVLPQELGSPREDCT